MKLEANQRLRSSTAVVSSYRAENDKIESDCYVVQIVNSTKEDLEGYYGVDLFIYKNGEAKVEYHDPESKREWDKDKIEMVESIRHEVPKNFVNAPLAEPNFIHQISSEYTPL